MWVGVSGWGAQGLGLPTPASSHHPCRQLEAPPTRLNLREHTRVQRTGRRKPGPHPQRRVGPPAHHVAAPARQPQHVVHLRLGEPIRRCAVGVGGRQLPRSHQSDEGGMGGVPVVAPLRGGRRAEEPRVSLVGAQAVLPGIKGTACALLQRPIPAWPYSSLAVHGTQPASGTAAGAAHGKRLCGLQGLPPWTSWGRPGPAGCARCPSCLRKRVKCVRGGSNAGATGAAGPERVQWPHLHCFEGRCSLPRPLPGS
jgi:hypothetical protein